MDDMDFPLPSLSVRRLLAVAIGLALVLVVAVRHVGGGHAAPVVAPVRVARAAPAKELVVDVAGAVARPGLYHLREGMRIADAVAASGGATARAELDDVNLAAPLADGEQVVVPQMSKLGGATGAPASPPSAGSSPTAPLDLNTASAEQLDALPGIGPATAQKIVDYRTTHGSFHSVDELDAVPGIGAGRIAQLKGLVIP